MYLNDLKRKLSEESGHCKNYHVSHCFNNCCLHGLQYIISNQFFFSLINRMIIIVNEIVFSHYGVGFSKNIRFICNEIRSIG